MDEISTGLAAFAACVFAPDDIVEVRLVPGLMSSWCAAKDLLGKAGWMRESNDRREHVYAGVNPRRAIGGRKAEDVAIARCLCIDLDHATHADFAHVLNETGLPYPTLVVHSGGGIHAYWRLDEPLADLNRWTAHQRAMIAAFGSDPKIHDPPRIMRLPGFVNWKPEVNGARASVLQSNANRVYALAEFPAPIFTPSVVLHNSPRQFDREHPEQLGWKTRQFLAQGAPEGGRNDLAFQAACELSANGYTAARVEELVLRAAGLCGLPDHEAIAAVKSALSKPRAPSRVYLTPEQLAKAFGPVDCGGPGPAPAYLTPSDAAEAAMNEPQAATATESSKTEPSAPASPPLEQVNGRPGLSNVEIKWVVDQKTQKPRHEVWYRQIDEISSRLLEHTNNWPKSCSGLLFVPDERGGVRYLEKPRDLFAWLARRVDVHWSGKAEVKSATTTWATPATKDEFHSHLRDVVPHRYSAVSELPHEPPIDNVYYIGHDLPKPTGKALAQFLELLNPETEHDRQLMLANALTLVWGGPCGTRPAFVYSSTHGRGCVAGETLIYDPKTGTHNRIDDLCDAGKEIEVLSLPANGGSPRMSVASCPFVKGFEALYEVETEDGNSITVTMNHRFLTPSGWLPLSRVFVGCPLASSQSLPGSTWGTCQSASREGDQNSSQTVEGSRCCCSGGCRQCGGQPHAAQADDQNVVPSQDGVPARTHSRHSDDLDGVEERSHHRQVFCRPSTLGSSPLEIGRSEGHTQLCSTEPERTRHRIQVSHPPAPSSGRFGIAPTLEQAAPSIGYCATLGTSCLPAEEFASSRSGEKSQNASPRSPETRQIRTEPAPCSYMKVWSRVRSIKFVRTDFFYDLHVPGDENYLANGIWNHNSGKTQTARFIGALLGGAFEVPKDETWEQTAKRLMSDRAGSCRMLLKDNVKGMMSAEAVEAFITSPDVSGWRPFHGDFSRPNYMTVVLTANTPRLGTDMADRAVEIRVGDRKRSDFSAQTKLFIEKHRDQLIADLIARLQEPPRGEISPANRDRWSAWQQAVLCRCDDPDALAGLVAGRREVADTDTSEASELAEAIDAWCFSRAHLKREDGRYPITRTEMMEILVSTKCVEPGISKRGAHSVVCNMLGSHGPLAGLADSPSRKTGIRQWLWTPPRPEIPV